MNRRSAARWRRAVALSAVLAALVTTVSGCGLNVRSADLFLLTRTGQGTKLTLLVNDSGTIRCNGAKAKPISDKLLVQARDLADNLGKYLTRKVSLPAGPGAVFSYRISLEQGTISFADRAAAGHQELAQTELFAAQAAQQACGLSG